MNRSRQGPRARKREGPRRYSRAEPARAVKRIVLIQGEGEKTEPLYFLGLRDLPEVKKCFALKPRKGVGYSATAAVERALGHMQRIDDDYDEKWCVVDTEGNPVSDDLKKAGALAAEHNIKIIRSHPSFEVWLLAHFDEDLRTAFNWQEAKALLDPHWQHQMGRPYDKADSKIYTGLSEFTHQAITNARRIHKRILNPNEELPVNTCWTEVYKLVAHLLGLPDTEA